jgi:hypothetical protein
MLLLHLIVVASSSAGAVDDWLMPEGEDDFGSFATTTAEPESWTEPSVPVTETGGPEPGPTHDSNLPSWAIALIVVGCVLVAGLVGLIVWVMLKRRKDAGFTLLTPGENKV